MMDSSYPASACVPVDDPCFESAFEFNDGPEGYDQYERYETGSVDSQGTHWHEDEDDKEQERFLNNGYDPMLSEFCELPGNEPYSQPDPQAENKADGNRGHVSGRVSELPSDLASGMALLCRLLYTRGLSGTHAFENPSSVLSLLIARGLPEPLSQLCKQRDLSCCGTYITVSKTSDAEFQLIVKSLLEDRLKIELFCEYDVEDGSVFIKQAVGTVGDYPSHLVGKLQELTPDQVIQYSSTELSLPSHLVSVQCVHNVSFKLSFPWRFEHIRHGAPMN